MTVLIVVCLLDMGNTPDNSAHTYLTCNTSILIQPVFWQPVFFTHISRDRQESAEALVLNWECSIDMGNTSHENVPCYHTCNMLNLIQPVFWQPVKRRAAVGMYPGASRRVLRRSYSLGYVHRVWGTLRTTIYHRIPSVRCPSRCSPCLAARKKTGCSETDAIQRVLEMLRCAKLCGGTE